MIGGTILIEKSSEKDNLWDAGISELLSFYLQEAGCEVVSRNRLSILSTELQLVNSGFSNEEFRKGTWLSADFILNGSLRKDSGTLQLSLSIVDSTSGNKIFDGETSYESEKNLLLEVKGLSNKILTIVSKKSSKSFKKMNSAKGYLFRNVDAEVLLKYFKAINLIYEGKEEEGIAGLFYVVFNAPKFEMPYFWISSYFEKNGFDKIAEGIRKGRSSNEDSSKPSAKKKIYLLKTNLQDEALSDHINKELLKIGFSVIEPLSLPSLEKEKVLKDWGFTNKDIEFNSLQKYSSSFIMKVECQSKDKYSILCHNSQGSVLAQIQNLTQKDLKENLVKILKSLSEKKVASLQPDIKNKAKPKVSLKSGYRDKQELLTDLLKELIRNNSERETLYKIINCFRFEGKQFHENFWQEILIRTDFKKDYLWLTTYLIRKHSLYDWVSGGYSPNEVLSFYKELEEKINLSDIPILNYCAKFNKACLNARTGKFKDALKEFIILEKTVSESGITKYYIEKEVYPSILYWRWFCAMKLKDSLEPEFKKQLEKRNEKESSSFIFLHEFISPLLWSGYSISIDSKGSERYSPGKRVFTKFSSKRAYKDNEPWLANAETIKWPELPRIPVEKTLKDAQQIVELFLLIVDSDLIKHQRGKYRFKIDLFIKALGHLLKHPDNTVDEELKKKIYDKIQVLEMRFQVPILCLLDMHNKALGLVEKSKLKLNQENNYKAIIMASILSEKDYLDFLYDLYFKSKEKYIGYEVLNYLINQVDLERSSQVLQELQKSKDPEISQLNLLCFEAELLRLKNSNIASLEKFQQIQKKYWGARQSAYNRGDLDKYLRSKITFLKLTGDKSNTYGKWSKTQRRIQSDHYAYIYSFRLNRATEILSGKIKSEFRKLYRQIYYLDKSSFKSIKGSIAKFVKAFGESALKNAISLLQNDPSQREAWIAHEIVRQSESNNKERLLIAAFAENPLFVEYAFSLNKEKAEEILLKNIWIYGGEGRYPNYQCFNAIIDHKIEQAYPVLFVYCSELRGYASYFLEKMLKHLKTDSTAQFKENIRLCSSQALKLVKKKKQFYHDGLVIAETAFKCGEVEGLKYLLENLKGKIEKKKQQVEKEILDLFNSHFIGESIKSIDEINEKLGGLVWDSSLLKWRFLK